MKKIRNIILGLLTCSTIGTVNVSAQEVKDIGNTPWKFYKVMLSSKNIANNCEFISPKENMSLLTDGNIQSALTFDDGNSDELTTIIIHPNGAIDGKISNLVCKFEDTSIDKIFFKVDVSEKLDGDWINIKNFISRPETISHKEIESVAEIDNTVGHIRQQLYSYIDVELYKAGVNMEQNLKYIRLTIKRVIDKSRITLPIKISEIEILSNENLSNVSTEDIIQPKFNDNDWEEVGIPHCYNDMDTYLNASDMDMWTGDVWYRKELSIDKKYQGKRIFLEFEGSNIGTAVYINGKFKKGNTKVEQPGDVTHVGGFIPFVVDITDDIEYGKNNILAVRVSNASNSFYTNPEFGNFAPFGMGWGGLVSPVYMIVKDKVHIPLDDYSVSGKWGTYNATLSANKDKAELRFQTNIENSDQVDKTITLHTILLDAAGKEVAKTISSKDIKANQSLVYDDVLSVLEPTLWYPNNSLYGKPYLYTVVRNVIYEGKIVDSEQSKFGIRTISWDSDYCYINEKKHLLNGFGYRNVYPALGSAVPAELQWKDMQLLAACGGNTLRVGHVPPTRETLEACDEYGIMVILNSGDNEWSLKNEPTNTYKAEYDRNAIIAFRNHTSVIVWESNNGIAREGEIYMPMATQSIVDQWDFIQKRAILNRDKNISDWDDSNPLLVGYTNAYRKVEGRPSINTEVYGANWEGRASWNAARFDYENEKKLTNYYVNNYIEDLEKKACGWIDWMLTETQGEGYTIYLNGKDHQKSLGSSAMDANRFPKLKYSVYENALWVPYEIKPGVTLQSHWNLNGVQDIDAWSNCPYVEMFLNGKSYGVRKPDLKTKNCKWDNIVWKAGEVRVTGMDENKNVLCEDVIRSAEIPYAIKLSIESPLTTPSGYTFSRNANGTDVIIVTARIVDEKGIWCPLYNENITFEVEGAGIYKGSSDFYVTGGKDIRYHAPGDKELQVEGGLVRVAVRSTFNPGKITIKATSGNLRQGEVSYSILPITQKNN